MPFNLRQLTLIDLNHCKAAHMIRLVLPMELYWLDLPLGVRLKVRSASGRFPLHATPRQNHSGWSRTTRSLGQSDSANCQTAMVHVRRSWRSTSSRVRIRPFAVKSRASLRTMSSHPGSS